MAWWHGGMVNRFGARVSLEVFGGSARLQQRQYRLVLEYYSPNMPTNNTHITTLFSND